MRSPSFRSWTGLLAIVGGLVAFATPTAAQTVVLPGQVRDGEDRPVAGIEVVLHRVTEGGGTVIAADTTDAAGGFTLRAGGEAPDAVYFAAARYEEQLHIGAMLRAPFPADPYILRLGGDPVAVGAGTTPAATEPTSARRAITLLVMAALLALGLFAFTRALRPPAQRRLLLRLAQIEEARVGEGGDEAAAEKERGRILARLRYGSFT